MELLNKGSIEKILRGEELSFPIVLLLEEARVLYVTDDNYGESGMTSIRLRLSDSVDSFFGFVCKTNVADQLIPGVLVSIEGLNVKSLDGNKIACKIINMTIIHDKKNSIDTQIGYLSSVLKRNDLADSLMEEKLLSIRLADVDLGTGKKNTLRARVSSKSAIRTYDLDQHKLFYFDVVDESGSLRVKAFDRQCDRLFQSVCIGEMIELSKFYVVVANKKYNQLNSDYEILVQEYTEFVVIRDVAPISIRPTFQFRLLREIELLKIDGFYDVIGIIKSVSPITVVYQRTTCKPLSIVRLLLFDLTGNIEISLWNDMASNFMGRKNDILAVKGFRLRLYHNKYSLNSVMDSEMFLNLSCEEADKLRSSFVSPVVVNDETKNCSI